MSQGREGAIKFDNTTRWRQIKKKRDSSHTGKYGSLFTVYLVV